MSIDKQFYNMHTGLVGVLLVLVLVLNSTSKQMGQTFGVSLVKYIH